MQIKNFRFKKIKIYIKNLIFKVNKIIFENESEKKIKEVKKIIQDVNQSNIESKLKDINNIHEQFQADPFLCKAGVCSNSPCSLHIIFTLDLFLM